MSEEYSCATARRTLLAGRVREGGGMTGPIRRGERLPPRGRAWNAAAAAHRRWRMPPREREAPAVGAFVTVLSGSIAAAERSETPYRHWVLRRCLPDAAVAPIQALPFPPPLLG